MTGNQINSLMAVPPRASFLGLPLEFRQMTYKYVLNAGKDLCAVTSDRLSQRFTFNPRQVNYSTSAS
jgi:hypothetical protein